MKRSMALILVMLAVNIFTLDSSYAETYPIDAAHTSIGFAVKHLTVSTIKGNFSAFDGSVDFDAQNLDTFKAEAVIQVNSINTGIVDRDKHLKSADFFDADQFPTITFSSTKLEKNDSGYLLFGSLTMKGVTKTIVIPVSISGPVPHPYGGTVIGISGKTTINRQDFGVSWNKDMDNGGVIVDNNVDIDINIEAHKK